MHLQASCRTVVSDDVQQCPLLVGPESLLSPDAVNGRYTVAVVPWTRADAAAARPTSATKIKLATDQ